MNKFQMQTPPNIIEFRNTSIVNEWVMRITADRRIEVNEDVEVTYAAKKVLEAVQHLLTPQRTWIGLTDEEISELIRATHNTGSFVRAIEAKLKEKNTWQDGDCKHCVNGCHACDARRQPNVLP